MRRRSVAGGGGASNKVPPALSPSRRRLLRWRGAGRCVVSQIRWIWRVGARGRRRCGGGAGATLGFCPLASPLPRWRRRLLWLHRQAHGVLQEARSSEIFSSAGFVVRRWQICRGFTDPSVLAVDSGTASTMAEGRSSSHAPAFYGGQLLLFEGIKVLLCPGLWCAHLSLLRRRS